jgi:hypothetical protein
MTVAELRKSMECCVSKQVSSLISSSINQKECSRLGAVVVDLRRPAAPSRRFAQHEEAVEDPCTTGQVPLYRNGR